MSMISSPCLDCPDRQVSCHSECEKYLAYRKNLDEISEQLRASQELEAILDNYEFEKRRKIKRR